MAGICSPTSFFSQPLPRNWPVDPNSAGYIANVAAQHAAHGSNLLFAEHSITLWVAGPNCPRQKIWLDLPDAQGTTKREALASVPIPPEMRPPPPFYGDNAIAIWDMANDEYFELHGSRQLPVDAARVVAGCSTLNESGWHCDDMSAIKEVSKSPGYFEPNKSWPGVSAQWGISAAHLSRWPGVIKIAEAQRLYIPHAICIATEANAKTKFRWPAQGTDGQSESATAPEAGMILAFPPDYNIAANISDPFLRAVATAGQRFGFVVTDSTGAGNGIAIKCESQATIRGSQAMRTDAWKGPTGAYGGPGAILTQGPVPLMSTFPWGDTKVVALSHRPSPVARGFLY